jgi:hypothetical protein
MRCPFRIQEITMRRAHLLAPLGVLAWLATPLPGLAQAPENPAAVQADALDPAAPTLALVHAPLPPSGAVATELTGWREANAAVAEFPRGHIDLLRWEAGQAGKAPPQPTGHGGHGSHGQGGRP